MSAGDDAYHEGREAGARGVKLKDNPHKGKSLEEHWSQGWRYGRMEAKMNKQIRESIKERYR